MLEKGIVIATPAIGSFVSQGSADAADAFWLKLDEFQWDLKTEGWRCLISGGLDATASYLFRNGVEPGFMGNRLHVPSYPASSIANAGWTNWGTVVNFTKDFPKAEQPAGGGK